ncbi:amino acid transporter LysE [Pseudomonas amygdali pv. mori str. 301020]|uniref:Amino acid transporter LysE n=1 Tax=Pseudomonas amygdali pv. mori str. 301020 TaxID=629261 RepID=A0A656G788_PSEA0|nr:amino acid transporter LysE [Pseudomonas amygdali pv. mori str. 301020]
MSASGQALAVCLRNVLRDPLGLRIFNGVMAVLLVASLYPLFVRALMPSYKASCKCPPACL